MKKNKRALKITFILIVQILCTLIVVFGAFFCVVKIEFPLKYTSEIKQNCEKYNLDYYLVCSLINQESRFNANAESKKGARGLMQIIPSTATFVAEKLGLENFEIDMLFAPQTNIEIGCYYLTYLFDKFENEQVVLCAYNAGETAVRSWLNDNEFSSDNKTLQQIPYTETNNYVKKINFYYKIYSKIY